jgi:hypothetical protein
MFAKAKGVRTVSAPKADKLAHDEVVTPVTKTVTPVSMGVRDVCALTEAKISHGVGGDNTPSSDKVKGPNI